MKVDPESKANDLRFDARWDQLGRSWDQAEGEKGQKVHPESNEDHFVQDRLLERLGLSWELLGAILG